MMAVALGGLVLGLLAPYLTLDAIGLPLFAEASGGTEVLLGPTARYLFGFVLASYVKGYLYGDLLK